MNPWLLVIALSTSSMAFLAAAGRRLSTANKLRDTASTQLRHGHHHAARSNRATADLAVTDAVDYALCAMFLATAAFAIGVFS